MDVNPTLPVGYLLGEDYEIGRVLGAGGFGNTYLARDKALSRDVAIKEYFPRDIARRGEDYVVQVAHQRSERAYDWARQRFIQEAKLLAKFRHPNIVRVFRTLDANNTSYIVLDYVHGLELDAWLASLGGPPSQEEIDELLAPLVEALDIVHRAGVLHRDIKPANIVIREETGAPILIDFGASKYSMGEIAGTTMAIVSRGYSPYEAYAADSGSQGPWTDIYGLGATIYHVLANAVPPEATERLLNDSILPLKDRGLAGFREEFVEAIDWAMQVQPKARPQTMSEWQVALFRGADPRLMKWQRPAPAARAHEENPGAETAPGTPAAPITEAPPKFERRKRGRVLAAAAAGLVIVAGAAGYFIVGKDWFNKQAVGLASTAEPTVALEPVIAANKSDAQSGAGKAEPPVPPSATPAPAAENPAAPATAVPINRQTALIEPPPVQLGPAEVAKNTAPAASADAPRAIAEATLPEYEAKKFILSADSKLLAAAVAGNGAAIVIGEVGGALRQLSLASGEQTALTKLPAPVTAVDYIGNDTRLVAAAGGDGSLVVYDAQTKSSRTLGTAASDGGFVKALKYSALTGELIVVDTKFGASWLGRWAIGGGSGEPISTTSLGSGIARAAAISRDKDLAVIVTSDERIRAVHYASGSTTDSFDWVPAAADWTSTVALSPDATLLARGGQYPVVEVFDAGAKARKLAVELGDQAYVAALAFSADGQRLAIDYTTYPDVTPAHRVRVIDVADGRTVAEISRSERTDTWLSFLPARSEYWMASATHGDVNICTADNRCSSN